MSVRISILSIVLILVGMTVELVIRMCFVRMMSAEQRAGLWTLGSIGRVVFAALAAGAPFCALLQRITRREFIGAGMLVIVGFLALGVCGTKSHRWYQHMLFRDHYQNTYFGTRPSFSKDGKDLVFGTATEHIVDGISVCGTGDIRILETDTGQVRNITTSACYNGQPAWSPDGTRVLFITDRDGNREIYAVDRDGRNLSRLTHTQQAESEPSYSPDGKAILFERDAVMWVMNIDGTSPRKVSSGVSPAWAPDGRQIVFIGAGALRSVDALRQSEPSIWLMDVATGSSRRSALTGQYPCVSPDSQWIAFVSDRSRAYWFEVWIARADGQGARQVTRNRGYNVDPQFSPDGRKIVFANDPHRDRRWEISTVDLDTGNVSVVCPAFQEAPKLVRTR
jgi:TolB protein